MTFLQFLGYFLVSQFLYQCLILGLYALRRYFAQRTLDNMVANGKIKIMTHEQLLEMMSEEEKKTWN